MGRVEAPRSRPGLSRRSFLLGIALLTVAGLALRLWGVTDGSFWLDEEWSRQWANSRSYVEVVDHARRDVHPPLYFLLLRSWRLIFGDGDVALRVLSVAFGTLIIPVGGVVAATIRDRSCGVLAAALLAVSRPMVEYSQEVRMYALLMLLTLGLLWAVMRFARHGDRLSMASIAALSLGLMLTHNTAVLLVAATFAGLLYVGRHSRGDLKRVLAVGFATAVVYAAAWGHVAVAQTGRPGLDWMRDNVAELGDLVAPVAAVFTAGGGLPGAPRAALELVTVGLFIYALVRARPDLRVIVSVMTLAPLAVIWTISQWHGMWVPRALSFIWPLVILMVAAALTHLPGRRSRVALSVFVAGAAALALILNPVDHQRQMWREACAVVEVNAQTADLVVVHASLVRRCFDRYYEGRPLETLSIVRETPDWRELRQRLAAAHARGASVWSVRSHAGPEVDEFIASVEPRWRLESERIFRGVDVRRFVPAAGPSEPPDLPRVGD